MRENYILNLDRLRKEREPIVPECRIYNENGPCKRIDGELCFATVSPKARWKLGPCNLASHVIQIVGEEGSGKKRVGQQKQKKQK